MSSRPDASPVPYVRDIHAQPQALRALFDAGLPKAAVRTLRAVRTAERIVLTGMGASLHALYPTYLRLLRAGLPVWLVETAELLGPAGALVTPRTALWITSQSGGTIEAVALLERMPARPAAVLALTNAADSELAAAADAVVLLQCGPERTVSTRSYMNTLAAAAMMEAEMVGTPSVPSLGTVPGALEDFLAGWRRHVDRMGWAVPDGPLFALGRHASLAAAYTGALIVKEAAAHAVEPLSAPQFRHGPLEMAGPGVTVLLLAGDAEARPLNERLREDLSGFGTNVVWLDPRDPDSPVPRLDDDLLRPFAEIVPFQALSVALGLRAGREPGRFRKIGKVTTVL